MDFNFFFPSFSTQFVFQRLEKFPRWCQQKKPADYVIATGKTFTIKEFVNKAAKKIGFKIRWVGNGVNEKAIDIKNKKVLC